MLPVSVVEGKRFHNLIAFLQIAQCHVPKLCVAGENFQRRKLPPGQH